MRRLFLLSLLLCSIIIFVINVGLVYQLGVYVDEQGIGPISVWGSEFWNYMDWLQLLTSFAMVILTFILYVNETTKPKNNIK